MKADISLNSIQVYTRLYNYEHECHPRGCGLWAFSIGDKKGLENLDLVFWAPANTYYSDAVKLAKKEAQKRGVSSIYVLP